MAAICLYSIWNILYSRIMPINKKERKETPDWKFKLKGSAGMRRTFVFAIRHVWKCDITTAEAEFERALNAGEIEPIMAGITKTIKAYKLK